MRKPIRQLFSHFNFFVPKQEHFRFLGKADFPSRGSFLLPRKEFVWIAMTYLLWSHT